MKHGEKTKGKASKASGKKASKTIATSKARSAASSKKQVHSTKTAAKSSASAKSGGNGKIKGRAPVEAISFSNPTVAAAFRRAIKKYPNAFRRLTD